MELIKSKALVTLKGGHQRRDELIKTLQGLVKQNLAPHKYPRTIKFMDYIP